MIEYRVRKVSRFVVTRYEEVEQGEGSIKTYSLFENNTDANNIAMALSLIEPGSSCRLFDYPKEECYPPNHSG